MWWRAGQETFDLLLHVESAAPSVPDYDRRHQPRVIRECSTTGGFHPVVRCGYIAVMASTGIRELEDHLSHSVRRIATGERIAVTAHGRVDVRLPLDAGDPFADWPRLRLPPGTAARLIEEDRGP